MSTAKGRVQGRIELLSSELLEKLAPKAADVPFRSLNPNRLAFGA